MSENVFKKYLSEYKAYKLEREFGLKYEVLGKNGLNCTLPNDGEKPGLVSEYTRRKISKLKSQINDSEKSINKCEISIKSYKSDISSKEKESSLI